MMTVDPLRWLESYKQGKPFRLPGNPSVASEVFSKDTAEAARATQVWLFGDGERDTVAPDVDTLPMDWYNDLGEINAASVGYYYNQVQPSSNMYAFYGYSYVN